MNEIIIDEFEKNSREKVMVLIKKFRNNYYLDIRVYFRGNDDEYKPSKKGLMISLELLDDLKDALSKVERALDEGVLDKIK